MATFIDTLISATVISAVMLVGVLASAAYEKWLERKARWTMRNSHVNTRKPTATHTTQAGKCVVSAGQL